MIRDHVEALQLAERYGFVHYFRDRLFDMTMLYWFNTMVQEDTLRTTMCLETPSEFMRFFDPDRIDVLLKLDPVTNTPWFVGWIDRVYDGGSANVWSARPRHGKKSTLQAIEDLLEIALVCYPVLVATTRPNLLDSHERLGYHILGTIPKLWRGNDVVAVYLNRGDLVRRTRKGEQQPQQPRQARHDDIDNNDGFKFGTYADTYANILDAQRPRTVTSRIREI